MGALSHDPWKIRIIRSENYSLYSTIKVRVLLRYVEPHFFIISFFVFVEFFNSVNTADIMYCTVMRLAWIAAIIGIRKVSASDNQALIPKCKMLSTQLKKC